MTPNFDEILLELGYKFGIVDLSKENQINELIEILKSYGVDSPNEVAQKARVYFAYLNEAKTPAEDILNKTVSNTETGNKVKVSTALQYKNSDNLGQQAAYQQAQAMFQSAGYSDKEIDKLSGSSKKDEPTQKPNGQNVFGKGKGGNVFEPKSGVKKEKSSDNRKNPNEGEVIKTIKPEELNQIIDKYVDTGEPSSPDMREREKNYSRQDMAEGYSDEEFYSKNNRKNLEKDKIKVRQQPYKIDSKTRKSLTDAGFPEKYIKFMERCINTQVKGKKPPVTLLIQQGGAGQIQSQFGEVCAMAFMSIRNSEQRKKLAGMLISEIKKSSEEFGGGKASAIATPDWVTASLSHAEAFDSTMDERYGKGRWKFEGAAWDIKNDIEGLGLDYANKGFSTDVLLRVQPTDSKGNPKGPAQAQRCSLKKDEKIFFFNGSINEVNNFVLNYLDEKERKKVKAYESIIGKTGASNKNVDERKAAIIAAERITGLKGKAAIDKLKETSKEIRQRAYNTAPKDIQDSITKIQNFGKNQLHSGLNIAKNLNTNIKNIDSAIDNEKTISDEDKKFAKFSYKVIKECKQSKDTNSCIREKLKKAGEETGDDRVCKLVVMASKAAIAAGDKNAEKALNKHYSIAEQAGNSLMEILPESPQLMGGLMQKLAAAFPIKTCMEGEEFMCIDGMKVTQKTLQSVFGVDSYDKLQQGLKLKKLPNGETILVYTAKGGKNEIPIGLVQARQKGKGYEGTVGFEIACNDDFAYAIAEANRKNGDTSSTNEKARIAINNRLQSRKNKK